MALRKFYTSREEFMKLDEYKKRCTERASQNEHKECAPAPALPRHSRCKALLLVTAACLGVLAMLCFPTSAPRKASHRQTVDIMDIEQVVLSMPQFVCCHLSATHIAWYTHNGTRCDCAPVLTTPDEEEETAADLAHRAYCIAQEFGDAIVGAIGCIAYFFATQG